MGNHGLQVVGKLHPNLGLLNFGEYVHNTVNRFWGAVGVKCAHDQVTRFCCRYRRVNGFVITHLSDQNHIWGLTQHGTKGFFKGLGVLSNLALVDDAGFVAVRELYRVFNGDNMDFTVGVNVVNHGC